MNLKRGLSNIAGGFFFILLDFSLTVNGAKITITPDFVGWLLLFAAMDHLGDYTADRKYLKWTALVMAILTGAEWLLAIFKPELEIPPIIAAVMSIISMIYMFILFGVLKQIAEDIGSSRAGIIGVLRVLNLAVEIGITVIGYLIAFRGTESSNGLAMLFIGIGVVGIVAAIVTAVVLFMLSGDAKE